MKMLHDDFENWLRDRCRCCMEPEEIDAYCKADLDMESGEYVFRNEAVQAQWEAWRTARALYGMRW